MSAPRAPDDVAIGILLRDLRTRAGLTEDEIARSAASCGLGWDRSTVSRIEHGRRRLYASELLLVPTLYGVSMTTLVARLPTPDRATRTTVHEADRKAARRLQVTAQDVVVASRQIWGVSLSEERERRLATGDRTQGYRGHVTRRLLAELAEHCSAATPPPGSAA